MTLEHSRLASQRRTIYCGIIFSIIHAFSFPLVLMVALLTLIIFPGPTINYSVAYTVTLIALLAPLSTLVSIVGIWVNYRRKDFDKMSFFCGFPFLAYLVVGLIAALLSAFV